MYGFEEFLKLLHSFAELVFLLNLFLSHIFCMLQKQCQEVNKHTEEEKLEEEKLGFKAWDLSYY